MIRRFLYLQSFLLRPRHNIMACAHFTSVYIATIENSTIIIVVVWCCCCCCCCWCRCCRCYYCCYYYLLFCAQINNRTTISYAFYTRLTATNFPLSFCRNQYAATNLRDADRNNILFRRLS